MIVTRVCKIFFGFLICGVSAMVFAQQEPVAAQLVPAPAPLETLLTIDPSDSAPRNSEGDIIRLSDGRLALVYTRFTGGDQDESAAHLALRTSPDGGRTWSADRTLLANEGGRNVMSVSMLRSADDKEILVFYLKKDSAGSSCTMLMRRSADDLQTLSDPVTVTTLPGYHVVNNDRVIRLTTGRLLVPSALHTDLTETTSTKFHPAAAMVVYYSDDDGRTWHKDASAVPTMAERKLTLQEPGVVELADGRVMMYIRTAHEAQYACYSSDGGISWTAPQPTELKSPLSPATIERIPGTDELLAVWNDHSGRWPFKAGNRTPLCMSVSTDDGKSWTPSVLLEGDPNGWYCYTSMTWTSNSLILTYCAGQGRKDGLNRLKVAEVPDGWVKGLGLK